MDNIPDDIFHHIGKEVKVSKAGKLITKVGTDLDDFDNGERANYGLIEIDSNWIRQDDKSGWLSKENGYCYGFM